MAKHKKNDQSAHAQKVRAQCAEEYSRMHTSALVMVIHAHTSF